MEVAHLRKLPSLPRQDLDFEQELAYGIRMTLVEDSVEYVVMVVRHPEEERFLMIVSLLNRRYWIVDLKTLQIEESNHELEQLYQLHKNRYFIFLESGRWIFSFTSQQERFERMAQFMNLQKLVRLRKRADDQLDSRFLKLFLRFNENKDDFIDDEELQQVLTSFDILFDETVKSCIREISPKSKQGLQKPEFHMLLRVLLCKRELIAVFRKYCPEFTDQLLVGSTVRSCMTPFMLQADFEKFLKEEQQLSSEEIQTLLMDAGLMDGKLSFHSFCKYIFSDFNSIINESKCSLYQNMDLPLTEYYVHSSHNTYLVGNQLTSDSKAFRYVEDFYDGVRCVELDIHDGSDGPIIKHGFTFTAPVSFRAVIEAIAEYSRDNEGHLPIILSFENHCGIQNQIEMSRILKELLDTKIYLVPQSCSNKHRFPSPNALRNKIIIQGTGLIDQIRPNILRSKIEMTASRYQNNSAEKALEGLSEGYPQEFLRSKKKFADWSENQFQQKSRKTKVLDDYILAQRQSMQVASEVQLMQYYSIFVSKMELQQACWEMGNISEANILNYIEDRNRRQSLVQFTRKCHVRVYPHGTRFGSSNYNPIPMYEVGAQLVSLNTQSGDIYNMVMTGNFMENGGKKGGYVLKPSYLRTDETLLKNNYQLTIRVMSVHNVSNNFDETCSVQVKMCLVCSTNDEAANQANCSMVEVTEEKPDVHFQATFAIVREFRCRITQMDFAHVYFQIPSCGHISIPVRMMRTGYRTIPLLDKQKQLKPNSYILAHIVLKTVSS